MRLRNAVIATRRRAPYTQHVDQAGVAQKEERGTRTAQAGGSTPPISSRISLGQWLRQLINGAPEAQAIDGRRASRPCDGCGRRLWFAERVAELELCAECVDRQEAGA